MNGAGYQLLAGAALTFDQDIRGHVAHLSDSLKNPLDGRALADDVLETVPRLHFGAQSLELLFEPSLFQGALDLDQNLFVVKRLGHVMKRARAHRLHRAFDGAERGDQQDQSAALDVAETLNQFNASHLRHHEVGDRQVETCGSGLIERRFAVISHVRFVPFLA